MGRKVGFLSAVVAMLLACAGSAQAAGSVFLCVPSAAGQAITSGGSAGSCKSGTTRVAFPASADEQQTLLSILPHISFVPGDKRTIRFSDVNVQVVNGTGDTRTTNGLGNLIIGYNEHKSTDSQTGSHNLVLGAYQTFTSYGGVIGGTSNRLTAPFSAVFGDLNTASGDWSSVTGGDSNTASGEGSSVSGGDTNTASVVGSSVSGGNLNTASGPNSSVSGGRSNTANGPHSSVSGGRSNTASGIAAAVFGCSNVTVSHDDASNPMLCP